MLWGSSGRATATIAPSSASRSMHSVTRRLRPVPWLPLMTRVRGPDRSASSTARKAARSEARATRGEDRSGRCCRCRPPALAADALGEGGELAARTLADIPLHSLGKRMVKGERSSAVPVQRQGTHRQMRGRLGVRQERERAPGQRRRLARLGMQECLRPFPYQQILGRDTIALPRLSHPFVERGSRSGSEPFEEIGREDGEGLARPSYRRRVEAQGVDVKCGIAQRERVAVGDDARAAEAAAEPSHCFIE